MFEMHPQFHPSQDNSMRKSIYRGAGTGGAGGAIAPPIFSSLVYRNDANNNRILCIDCTYLVTAEN